MLITGLTAATSNDVGTAGNGINAELGISWNAISLAAGALFIGIGYCTLLLSPASWLYGRRISYLIYLILSLIGSIWFACVETVQDNIWNQLFVGASESCAEALVQLSLSDFFFQHQRGLVLGIYVLATSVGTFLGPLVSGYITDNPTLGWRWVGWFAVIISGTLFVVFYFGLEETVFDRKDLDGSQAVTSFSTRTIETVKVSDVPKEQAVFCSDSRCDNEDDHFTPKSYWQRIALITPSPTIVGYGFKQYGRVY